MATTMTSGSAANLTLSLSVDPLQGLRRPAVRPRKLDARGERPTQPAAECARALLPRRERHVARSTRGEAGEAPPPSGPSARRGLAARDLHGCCHGTQRATNL